MHTGAGLLLLKSGSEGWMDGWTENTVFVHCRAIDVWMNRWLAGNRTGRQ